MKSQFKNVTDIGTDKYKLQRTVTREYEEWELYLLKNTEGHTYHGTCQRCGLEIVGALSNCYDENGCRLVYSSDWHARTCYPCQLELNRLRRLEKRRKARVKECPICGAVFSAQRSDTVYCSDACKQKNYRNGSN